MKKGRSLSAVIVVLGLGALLASAGMGHAAWEGVDATVVEKFAEKAGRSAHRPLIDTDQGDLLLFAFLLAGLTGGFIGGYLFRGLFGSLKKPGQEMRHDV